MNVPNPSTTIALPQQRPTQHDERRQAYRRQRDEQRGGTGAAKTELLQNLNDRHFAGSGNDEERSGGSQCWNKPGGVTDGRRHLREEPRPDHAEGKNQHKVFRDQPDGETDESAAPREKEGIVIVGFDRRAGRTPIGGNKACGQVADDDDERHAQDQSKRRPLPAEDEADEHQGGRVEDRIGEPIDHRRASTGTALDHANRNRSAATCAHHRGDRKGSRRQRTLRTGK